MSQHVSLIVMNHHDNDEPSLITIGFICQLPSTISWTIIHHHETQLTLMDHYSPSWSIIDHHPPSLAIISHKPSSNINDHQPPTINHSQSINIIDHRYKPFFSIVDHLHNCHASFTIIDHQHHQPSTSIINHCWSSTINKHHYTTLTNHYQGWTISRHGGHLEPASLPRLRTSMPAYSPFQQPPGGATLLCTGVLGQ